MRKVEIARRIALEARDAERSGSHRRAAELYAEALRVLLLGKPSSAAGEAAATPHVEPGTAARDAESAQPKNTLVRRTQGPPRARTRRL